MKPTPGPRALIVELCRQFYAQGWVSGTGGGISVRDGDRIYMAPSGVQKERLDEDDMFVLSPDGDVTSAPGGGRRLTACAPLFMQAYRLRDAGAVVHSHSVHALTATLLGGDVFRATHLEMLKGIRGHGYRDELRVPIIDNTPHESDLAGALAGAIEDYPDAHAVLVRRHGVYVWGRDWVEAKTHAESYHYVFEAAVEMRRLGIDAGAPPGPAPRRPRE